MTFKSFKQKEKLVQESLLITKSRIVPCNFRGGGGGGGKRTFFFFKSLFWGGGTDIGRTFFSKKKYTGRV